MYVREKGRQGEMVEGELGYIPSWGFAGTVAANAAVAVVIAVVLNKRVHLFPVMIGGASHHTRVFTVVQCLPVCFSVAWKGRGRREKGKRERM